jgi:hypothetical protein
MKQKTSHAPAGKFKRWLVTSLVIGSLSGMASAQTTVFYSDTGSGSNAASGYTSSGDLDSIGYDSSTYISSTGATAADTGTISTRPTVNVALPAYYQNYSAVNLPTSIGTETLQSVTLYLYAESVNPDGSSLSFTIYDSLNGTGNTIPLTLSNTNEGTFFSFTLTAEQFAGGFSIGATGLPTNALLNISSEENASVFQTPGLLATYSAIPEPSAILLGAASALGLLRRRRA